MPLGNPFSRTEDYCGEWYTPELPAEDYHQFRMKEKGYAAIAMLLNGDVDGAAAALEGDGARTEYLRAIVAARKGNTAEARKHLDAAKEADKAFAERAASDIEFATLAN